MKSSFGKQKLSKRSYSTKFSGGTKVASVAAKSGTVQICISRLTWCTLIIARKYTKCCQRLRIRWVLKGLKLKITSLWPYRFVCVHFFGPIETCVLRLAWEDTQWEVKLLISGLFLKFESFQIYCVFLFSSKTTNSLLSHFCFPPELALIPGIYIPHS